MDLPVWFCTGSGSRHFASSSWLPGENLRDASEHPYPRRAAPCPPRPPAARHHVLLRSRWPRRWLALAGDQDRKSTRLNSSHTVISYAVFCLKKKKKKHTLAHQLKHHSNLHH